VDVEGLVTCCLSLASLSLARPNPCTLNPNHIRWRRRHHRRPPGGEGEQGPPLSSTTMPPPCLRPPSNMYGPAPLGFEFHALGVQGYLAHTHTHTHTNTGGRGRREQQPRRRRERRRDRRYACLSLSLSLSRCPSPCLSVCLSVCLALSLSYLITCPHAAEASAAGTAGRGGMDEASSHNLSGVTGRAMGGGQTRPGVEMEPSATGVPRSRGPPREGAIETSGGHLLPQASRFPKYANPATSTLYSRDPGTNLKRAGTKRLLNPKQRGGTRRRDRDVWGAPPPAPSDSRQQLGGSGRGSGGGQAVRFMPTLHPTPYTLHPTPYTLHPATYTLHPTPYTLHPTPATFGMVLDCQLSVSGTEAATFGIRAAWGEGGLPPLVSGARWRPRQPRLDVDDRALTCQVRGTSYPPLLLLDYSQA